MDYFNNYAQCIYYTKFYKQYKNPRNIVREYMEYNLAESKYFYEFEYNKFINYYFDTSLNIKKNIDLQGNIYTIYTFNGKTIRTNISSNDIFYIYDNLYIPSLTIVTIENDDDEYILELCNVDVRNIKLGNIYYFHIRK